MIQNDNANVFPFTANDYWVQILYWLSASLTTNIDTLAMGKKKNLYVYLKLCAEWTQEETGHRNGTLFAAV